MAWFFAFSVFFHFVLRGRSVDLARCSSWLKFCEVHEEDRSTVIFLCGGGVRVAEVSEASMDMEVWWAGCSLGGVLVSTIVVAILRHCSRSTPLPRFALNLFVEPRFVFCFCFVLLVFFLSCVFDGVCVYAGLAGRSSRRNDL